MINSRHLKSTIGRMHVAVALALGPYVANAQVTTTPSLYAMSPFASFYNASDPGTAPVVVDLSGVPTGALLYFFPVGYIEPFGGSSAYFSMRGSNPWTFAGIFSTTNTLLPWMSGNPTSRVPDAVASGLPEFTSFVGWTWSYPTDLPHDFRIDQPLAVAKPAGASFLFLGVLDDQYWDNRTAAPNQFGVYVAARTDGTIPTDPNPTNAAPPYTAGGSPVTATPEPASVALVGLGLIGMGAAAQRRRRNVA